ncbi:MAG: hypothetical protein OET44_02000 [Gammaproteobacteria bacterium]|nr:hypothetical protein [Gammaproteobacteria bacterium]
MSRERKEPQSFSNFQERFTLGKLEGDFPIELPEEASDAVITLAEQSRRIVQIFTRELDSDVYDNQRFVRALSFVARRTPTSEVQILVQDPKPAINSNHLLIELCQQLTSYIKVRRVSDDYLLAPDEFLLADKVGFMYRKSYLTYEGVVNFNSPSKAQRLDEVFNEIWNISSADPEFRLLHI